MLAFDMLTPSEQIALLMKRTYEHGMTTTSGGNLSVRDEEGNIWISPSGVDKGTLRPADIVCVRPDGTTVGLHKPSIEFAFHQAVYQARPDLRAILHAHPSALVAFSVVRMIPDTHILPQAEDVCGKVGFAPYALPGSAQLGQNIAASFHQGFDCVMMENHGVVCGGASLLEAYHRFETLDFCARLHIQARQLGPIKLLSSDQLQLAQRNTPATPALPELPPTTHTTREKELRRTICDIVHRAYDRYIMTSTEGTLSARLSEARLDDGSFLITPYGVDRRYLDVSDIVLIRAGHREPGKQPSRAALFHQTIYDQHPEIQAIISAQPPSAMAFGVTDQPFEIRTIPESYFMLRDVPKVPFGPQWTDPSRISSLLGPNCPVLMIENDAVVAVGSTILQAYDRLEVAEFTARSILQALPLGKLAAMGDKELAEIRKAFM